MKKNLLFFSILVFSLICPAYAHDASPTNDSMLRSGGETGGFGDGFVEANQYAAFPVIASLGVSVEGTCLEADKITLNGGTAEVCTRWAGPSICGTKKTVELKTSIYQQENVCVKPSSRGVCNEYQMQNYQIPIDYDIKIYERPARGGVDFGHPLFTKSWSIPACTPQ